jgi:hypothetical protein
VPLVPPDPPPLVLEPIVPPPVSPPVVSPPPSQPARKPAPPIASAHAAAQVVNFCIAYSFVVADVFPAARRPRVSSRRATGASAARL